jgi:hypothetical protein
MRSIGVMNEHTAGKIERAVVEAGSRAVRDGLAASPPPNRLYHFTECEGLVSILHTRSLRASLATGMSDDSEVRHGVTRARQLLSNGAADVAPAFRARVAHFLEPGHTFADNPVGFHAYVISFCSRMDRSVHWLHYGRQGTGFALGFDVNHLPHRPFQLVQVVYDEAQQDRILSSIVECAWKPLADIALRDPETTIENRIFDEAARSVAAHLRMAAPALKSRVFADEEEWRLITYDLPDSRGRNDVSATGLPKRFRVMAGRIVPHVELHFDELPLTEIVLGANVPMDVDDPALSILLRESGIDQSIAVNRSPVPLRP